jgi:hypothetical protein
MALFNFKKAGAKTITTNLAGGAAYVQTPEMQLASLLLTSFVKNQFYRDAKETLDELVQLLDKVDPVFAAQAGVYARREFGMRSITHALAAALATRISGQPWAKHFYNTIVRRPDDMLEIAAAFQLTHPKTMLPNAMKKGFAAAFERFDAYQLAKYQGTGRAFKLVDMMNLAHPRASARNAEALQQLANGVLKNTATWEAQLTQAGQLAATEEEKELLKSETWTQLLDSGKLGYLATLRNLRNIVIQAPEAIPQAAQKLRDRVALRKALVLPFQLMVAQDALRALPAHPKLRLIEDALNDALSMSVDNVPRFEGRTLVVIDDSGSMGIAAKGTGFGARSCIQIGAIFAAALFKANDADLMRFADSASYIKANAQDSLATLAEGIIRGAKSGGTNFNAIFSHANQTYDRIILLSDMQGWMGIGAPDGAFNQYCRRVGRRPYLYSFDLAGYGSLQFPESKVFCLAGFSDKVFDLMQMLEIEPKTLIQAIRSVSFLPQQEATAE